MAQFWVRSVVFAVLVGLAPGLNQRAWASGDPLPTRDGTCSAADFRTAWNGAAELPADLDQYQVQVLRDGAVLYANPTGNDRLKTLRFNSKAYVRAHDVDRLGVALEGERSVVGWVRRRDLLCMRTPLVSREDRQERTAITSPGLEGSGTFRPVDAFQTPEMEQCRPICRELTRFRLYFVAAETAEAVLLAESATFQSSRGVLVGWVAKSEVTDWTTRLGLRGAGASASMNPRPICGYLTLDEMRARRPDACREIAHGASWFKTEYRLPVLRVENDHYQVLDGTGDRVRRLFVPLDENVEIDVLLRLNQLETWTDVFTPLTQGPDDSIRKWGRTEFINTLVKSIETVIGEPSWDSQTDKLAEYVRRSTGLPMGTRSQLLSYSIDELQRADLVPECELIALLEWARASRQMLRIAQSGDKLAKVELKPLSATDCPVSPMGKNLRIPAGKVELQSIAPGTIAWQMFNETFYWVPQDYLP